MAINLTNPQKKKGALDALSTLLTSKTRPVQLDPDECDQTKNKPSKQAGENGAQGSENASKNDLGQQSKPNQSGQGQQNGDSQQSQSSAGPEQNSSGRAKNGSQSAGDKADGQAGQNGSKDERLTVNGLIMPKNSSVKDKDEDVSQETEEERKERIKKINDPDEIQKDLDDIRADAAYQDQERAKAEKERIKAEKNAAKEAARKARGGILDFEDFANDLFMAMKSQIGTAKEPEDTWLRPNPSYAGTDYLMPGQDYPDKKTLPSLAIYFDQSGSWGRDDVRKGVEAINVLNGFVARHKIKKIDLYYFSNHLHTNPPDDPNANGKDRPDWHEGGTHGFPEVMENIEQNGYTNVIVMSDDDIEDQTNWNRCSPLKLKGYVWFIWRDSKSPTAVRYLQGERGTSQYML